jgi:hypothetical protein
MAPTSKAESLLFRLRPADTPSGISGATLAKLAAALGLPETQVIHQALRKLATEVLPGYEADEAPVSDRMIKALKKRVPQRRYKSVASSLFAK